MNLCDRSFSTILVTGGCGFIGSNFILEYHRRNPTVFVVNIDMVDYCASEDNVEGADSSWYILYRTNICEMGAVCDILARHKPGAIIHFAAQTHVDNSFGNSIPFTKNNVTGTHCLLEACRFVLGTSCLFLHISTDEVYGEVSFDHPGCCEKSILNPTNPYAASKAAAEFIVRSYHHSFNIPVLITRGNNVYGPRQYPEKLIPRFITQFLKGNKFTVQGDGLSRRNFVYVQDVARAIITVLTKGCFSGGIYNIGGQTELSVLEVAKFLQSQLSPSADVSGMIMRVPDRAFNDKRYAINTSALSELGWKEEWRFEDGIRSTISWYRQRVSQYSIDVPHVRPIQVLLICNHPTISDASLREAVVRTSLMQKDENLSLDIHVEKCTETSVIGSMLNRYTPDKVLLYDVGGPLMNVFMNDSPLDVSVERQVVYPLHLAIACQQKGIPLFYLYDSDTLWLKSITNTMSILHVTCLDLKNPSYATAAHYTAE